MSKLKFAYAGDRDISVWVLQHLLEKGLRPSALLLSDQNHSSHSTELRQLCSYLDESSVFLGKSFREQTGIQFLTALQPDFIICVHFPYLVPRSVLDIPHYGVLNLHPAYLPYNRGWHTATWALLEQSPIGATLHFMDEGVDTGDIIHQRLLIPSAGDTAHTLYSKLKILEYEVFKEALPSIVTGNFERKPQIRDAGTTHKRAQLFSPEVQEIDLDAMQSPRELLRRLRALTTNNINEAAFYRDNHKTYRVQVTIVEE